ncbi:ER membrane protein complex subunit 6, putative [Plasmodium ovale]|uniref:ER membrane protein complex subunit 6 n=1 Tax=Plasmodium ovale TaxID=36330 RepID=A0A1D3U9Z9_PLAOA|nr:ER membrane protein complex subunit 6, putative [Plasmodium ovale]
MEGNANGEKQNEVKIKSILDFKLSENHKYNDNRIKYNKRSLILSKQFYGIIGGITVGILGIQGINGFLLFPVFTLIGTLMTFFHIRDNFESFFLKKSDVICRDFFSGLISFILFWTLSYDIIYIF